jgi:anti-anti-sigma factor
VSDGDRPQGEIHMSINIAIDDRTPLGHFITLHGRLDTNTAPELDQALDTLLADAQIRRLVFDLEGVEYLSSAGIRCFIRARKIVEPRHGHVALVKPQPSVRKVLEIVKAMPSNGIFASAAELDSYLHDMQEKVRRGD